MFVHASETGASLPVQVHGSSRSAGVAYSTFMLTGSTGMLVLNATWCKLIVAKSVNMINKARHGQPPTPDYQIDGRANKNNPFRNGKNPKIGASNGTSNGHAAEEAGNGKAALDGNAKTGMQLRGKRDGDSVADRGGQTERD